MGEQPFPDGKTRGGFARLAAVVKAEREKARAEGRSVIVAHGGDTLSPSVMSGLDQRRAHHRAHQHDRAGHFRARQSRVRFRQGGVPRAHGARRRSRSMARTCATRTARRCRGFKDRSMLDVGGVRIGLTGLAYEQSPRMSSPEDLRFGSTHRHHQGAGRGAARGGRGLRLRGPALQSRRRDRAAIRARRRTAAHRPHARPVRQLRRQVRAGRVRL